MFGFTLSANSLDKQSSISTMGLSCYKTLWDAIVPAMACQVKPLFLNTYYSGLMEYDSKPISLWHPFITP